MAGIVPAITQIGAPKGRKLGSELIKVIYFQLLALSACRRFLQHYYVNGLDNPRIKSGDGHDGKIVSREVWLTKIGRNHRTKCNLDSFNRSGLVYVK